ncbi:MAG: hypothetical protein QG551_66 [Patescibacteria group bacterium]|jgi:hypothetical protein|nr:hypothetical protein [Patescibacteria group bacterium]
MKNILILVGVAVLFGGIMYFSKNNDVANNTNNERIMNPGENTGGESEEEVGKLKVANFTGKLEEVNVGCFVDGECYVVVDGKHITTTMGWSQETVGTVQGVEGFGDLESHIGSEMEVYARDNGDGTYSLYGSEGFYIKLVK